MASSIKRERQLARERYERQQAKRAASRARKRRWQQVTAVVVAVLLVIGGVAALTALLGDDEPLVAGNPTSSPSASVSASPPASPSPSVSAGCTYAPAEGEPAKDVGTPTFDEAAAKKPFTATVKTNQWYFVSSFHHGPVVFMLSSLSSGRATSIAIGFPFSATGRAGTNLTPPTDR